MNWKKIAFQQYRWKEPCLRAQLDFLLYFFFLSHFPPQRMTSLHICYPNTCFAVVFEGRKRHFCFNITVIRTEIGDFFMKFAYILHMAYKLALKKTSEILPHYWFAGVFLCAEHTELAYRAFQYLCNWVTLIKIYISSLHCGHKANL